MRTANRLTISLALLLSCTSGTAGDTEALELAAALGMEQRWSEAVIAPAIDPYLMRLSAILQPRPSDAELNDLRTRLMEAVGWERVGRFAFVAAWGTCSASTLTNVRRVLTQQEVHADDVRRTEAELMECTRNAEAVLEKFMLNALEERLAAIVQEWIDERKGRGDTRSGPDAGPAALDHTYSHPNVP